MVNVNINYDQCHEIVLATLKECLDDPISDNEIIYHIQHVIAYFSPPGEYMNGQYDSHD